MAEEKKELEEKEKKSSKPSSSKTKVVVKKYEVILVSDNYIVYKLENGSNGWKPVKSGHKHKVGDRVEL